MKFLLLILAIVIVYHVLKRYRRTAMREDRGPRTVEETMVRCERCGVHLPRSESVLTDGSHYCSRQHAGLPDR